MTVLELADPEIPKIYEDESIGVAIDKMEAAGITHITVVDREERFKGICALDSLLGAEETEIISNFNEDFIQAKAYEDTTFFDGLLMIGKNEISVLPLVNLENKVVAQVLSTELLFKITQKYAFSELGGYIVLQMGIKDYNLSEIARITEVNDVKILFSIFDISKDKENIVLYLKLNTLDLRSTLSTFERYKYKVIYYYPHQQGNDELKDRYDLLLKLFDI
jgi:CBS domain-containing protein